MGRRANRRRPQDVGRRSNRRRAQDEACRTQGEAHRVQDEAFRVQSKDEALFEAIHKEFGVRDYVRGYDVEIINSRLTSSQREKFEGWSRMKWFRVMFHETTPDVTIGAIQNTDFTSHTSRRKLGSLISDAVTAFRADDDHFLPLGRWNGHRFGLHPVRNVEQYFGRGSLVPYAPWKQNNLEKCGVTFGVRERTYGQLWCPPPETGLPQGSYGRCSGHGLLGSFPSPYSFRQLSLSSDTASPQRTAGEGSDSSAPSSRPSSPRNSASGPSGNSSATSLVDANRYTPADHAFFPLGRIHVETTFNGDKRPQWQRWAETAHIVAVDTSDQSVWMLYEAWYKDEGQWEPDPCYDPDDIAPPDEIPSYGRFRPEHEPDWARLEGHDGRRRVMAKLADDIRSWRVGSYDVPLVIGDDVLPDGVLLIFTVVGIDRDRKLVLPY